MVVDPICPIREEAPETTHHLFQDYFRVKSQWDKLRNDTRGTPLDFGGCSSLCDLVLLAITHQRRCPTLFLLILERISLIWIEKNAIVFRDKWAMASTFLMWRKVGSSLEAI